MVPFVPSGGEERERLSGGRLIVESGRRLATKIYPNGVEVIIKGIQPTKPIGGMEYGERNKGTGVVQSQQPLPTTLPPTTVSNHFHLLEHPNRPNTAIDHLLQSMARSVTPDLVTRTMMTTFTYYQTILQDETTVVRSSEDTVSNLVTEQVFPGEFLVDMSTATPLDQTIYSSSSPIPAEMESLPSSRLPDMATQTRLSTFTFTKTLLDIDGPHVVTQYETMTDLVVSHAPALVPLKTFYTTYTTFLTSLEGSSEITSTSTSVTSHVETPTLLTPSSTTTRMVVSQSGIEEEEPIRLQPVMIYATKTFYTTTTFLTSILGDGNETRIQSRTSVVSNVVTEAISTVLNGNYLVALQSSYLAEHPPESAELETTERDTTLLTHSEVSIRTIEGTYVPDTLPSQVYPKWPKDADEGIMEGVQGVKSTPTLNPPQLHELRSEIHHIIQELVGTTEESIRPTTTTTHVNVYPTRLPIGGESTQEPTPPLTWDTDEDGSLDGVTVHSDEGSKGGDQVGVKKSGGGEELPGGVFGHLRQPIGEKQHIFNMFSGEEAHDGVKVDAAPDYYDEVKEETAFKETYSDEEESHVQGVQGVQAHGVQGVHQQTTQNVTRDQEEVTTEMTLETLQQEILDEIPVASDGPTERITLKFTSQGKPIKYVPEEPETTRRPKPALKPPPPDDYDESPDALGNVYNLILPKPPVGSSSSGDDDGGQGSSGVQDDENKKEEEESDENDDGPEGLQRRPSFGGSNLVVAGPPVPPSLPHQQDVTISQTGNGINWNPLLKLGAIGLGGLGASALTKWPLLGSMSGLLKTAGAGLILARNDSTQQGNYERPMRNKKRPFRGHSPQGGMEMEESGNIPRRPVVTHANEPNFRFENGPPGFGGQGQWGQRPMDMRVVLTPVGPGHEYQQQLPSSNMVRVVAGNPLGQHQPNYFRQPPTMAEKPMWTNQIILPLPPESNEIQEASEEITRMRPPPEFSRPQAPIGSTNQGQSVTGKSPRPTRPQPTPAQSRLPIGPSQNYFQSQEQKTQGPSPTPVVHQDLRRPSEEIRIRPNPNPNLRNQQSSMSPPNFKERRPSSPIPTGISSVEIQRPRRPTSPPHQNQIQEQGPKKVEKIPPGIREERRRPPPVPPPTVPTPQQPITRGEQNFQRPTSFSNYNQGETSLGIRGQGSGGQQRPPNPFQGHAHEQGPVSLEFIPTNHNLRPFQPIPTPTSQRPIPLQIHSQETRPFPEGGGISYHPNRPQMPTRNHQAQQQPSWEEPEGFMGMFTKPGGHLNPFNPRPPQYPPQQQQQHRPQFFRESSEEVRRPSVIHHQLPQNHHHHAPSFLHPRPQTMLVPMSPHGNFPTIALSSEEVMTPPPPPFRKVPASFQQQQQQQQDSQEQSQEEFPVRRPVEGQFFRRPQIPPSPPIGPIPPPPQRFPFGGQGLYEMNPGGKPPVLLPGTQQNPPPQPTLNSHVLLPGWGGSMESKPQPTPHFPPFQKPNTVYIVEETYDPPPRPRPQSTPTLLPDTQHQLVIKEIRKDEPKPPPPTTMAPATLRVSTTTQTPRPNQSVTRRPMFIRRSSTTPQPESSTTPPTTPSSSTFSFGLFPQGFQFSTNIQEVLNRVAPPKPTQSQFNNIRSSHEVKGQSSAEVKNGQGSRKREETGSSVQVEVKDLETLPTRAGSPEVSSGSDEGEEKLTISEEEALLKAFAPPKPNTVISNTSTEGWWDSSTFRPHPPSFLPTTFRNEMSPTTYRSHGSNGLMRATTFRPRRPLLSNPPNQVPPSSPAPPSGMRKPWESLHENEGLDQVKLKNVEIHKTPGFVRTRNGSDSGMLGFLPSESEQEEEENQVGGQIISNKPEEDLGYDTDETYEVPPPGFPAMRLTPPPPPPHSDPPRQGHRPFLRRPVPPQPRPRPFDSLTNIFRRPPQQPQQVPNGPESHGPTAQRWPPPKPFLAPPAANSEKEYGPGGPIMRRPSEPPRLANPRPDYTIANNFHKVRPIPLNPSQNTLPPPRIRQIKTSSTLPPPAESSQEENEVEEIGNKNKRPLDLRPAADGDPFYESEEKEEEEEESPEINHGNRHVGGHVVNSLPRPISDKEEDDEEDPKVELEPPPIDSNRLKPPVMELPSNGPIRVRPKPNLLRPEENVHRPDLRGTKPNYHTIATVDEENKIIGTNLIPAFLPTRTHRPHIQPSRTRTETQPERRPGGPQLVGSVETVDLLHGTAIQGESKERSTIVKYSSGTMTSVPQVTSQVEPVQIKPTRAFTRQPIRPTLTPFQRSTPPNFRLRTTTPEPIRTPSTTPELVRSRASPTPEPNRTPSTTPEPIRTRPTTPEPARKPPSNPELVEDDDDESEESEEKLESSTRMTTVGQSSPILTTSPPLADTPVKIPALYKPRKPFMPIRNPQEGVPPPWRQRTTTMTTTSTTTTSPSPTRRSTFLFPRRTTSGPEMTSDPPSSTTTPVPIVEKIMTAVTSTTSTTTTPRLESSEEEEDEEEEEEELLQGQPAEMTPTTFRPPLRPQYFSTPPPRDNFTTTTLITKEGAVLAVVKKVTHSTASSVSTRLPVPKPTPSTRYVTHSGTVTQTFTETEIRILPSISEGAEAVTETILITRVQPPETVVSTIIGGATIINEISHSIQPTVVRTTIYSQPTQVPTTTTSTITARPTEREAEVKKPAVIRLPLPNGFTPTASSKKVQTEEKILDGGSGILVRKTSTRPPVDRTTEVVTLRIEEKIKSGGTNCTKLNCSNGNQMCRGKGVEAKCGCKPGYARMKPTFPCRPTYTYEMSVSVKDLEEPGMTLMRSGSESELKGGMREALETAFLTTDLRRQFQGTEVMKFKPAMPSRVYVDFLVQMTVNMTEDRIRTQLIRTLRNSNFSVERLGILSPEASSDFSARDFNECVNSEYNDCSGDADCVNLRGSFTCACKEGYKDRKKQRPGRDCTSLAGCSECNYKGNCGRDKNGNASCECFRWHAGADCRWNLKVLLMGVIGVGSLLFCLIVVSIVIICRRKLRGTPGGIRERPGSGRFMRYRSPTSQATLERTAIMHDTASSTGSDESPIQPLQPQRNPSYTPDSLVEPGTGHRGHAHPRKSQNNLNNFSLRPSAMDPHDVSPMSVVIPRAKIRSSPTTGSDFMRSDPGPGPSSATHHGGIGGGPSAERKLINYLEGGGGSRNAKHSTTTPQPSTLQREKEAQAFRKLSLQERRNPSGALVSSGTEVSARGGGMRRRSTGLEPDFPPRVYDKTLSDIRSSRASCYSCNKPPSYCGGYSESAGHTMAEKDGASTVYTVQGKLFRLAHDTDSNLSSD